MASRREKIDIHLVEKKTTKEGKERIMVQIESKQWDYWLECNLSTITLNVNGINVPNKNKMLLDWLLCACLSVGYVSIIISIYVVIKQLFIAFHGGIHFYR